MNSQDLAVRINGVLPDVSGQSANTSISVFYKGFHLLVDAGNRVRESVTSTPDAILITSAKEHHTSDLPALLQQGGKARAYCTSECSQQIKDLVTSPIIISPGIPFDAGPFRIIPIAADNAGDNPSMPGSVIYVIKAGKKKVVAGWDFLKLPGVDNNILWNPDLLILGTETYNEHPSTGMISVSQAYDIVRRWNAKLCYILHYSGEKDREDAKNQWHRGPTGPLSPDELQKAVDDHLRVTGGQGKYVIKVAKEGMTWSPAGEDRAEDNGPIGPRIEVDALDRHILVIEKSTNGMVIVTIEDSIHTMTSEFADPKVSENSLRGEAVRSMMMKGPELNLMVSGNNVRIDITKGKKSMFAGDIPVDERDAKRIIRYLHENFH
ncbi:MAG TPA: MBL fold metallo-hydrolase [Nitrososphaera sp.]|nr:MBL fold metallo-hydrolase [Nitrososphaera sp.]